MKLGISQLSIVVILAGPLFAFAAAQIRPDLNGTWKLNRDQSKFSDPDAAPKDVVLRFEQQGQTLHETLTVINAGGKSTVSLNYALNGGVSINNVDGEEIKSAASWSGDTLVLEWRDKGGTFTRRFAFSDKGRKITVNTHDTDADGETDELLVFEKQ